MVGRAVESLVRGEQSEAAEFGNGLRIVPRAARSRCHGDTTNTREEGQELQWDGGNARNAS